MITHYFPYYGGNSLFIRLDSMKAVLIDTPYDGVATIALLEWINNTFRDLELVAIVTGFHQDNLGGNEELIARNIPVFGMTMTADLVRDKGDELKRILVESVKNSENKSYFERYSTLNLVPPNRTFMLKKGETKIIEVASEKFEFFYPGESHTVDNAVVFVHKEKILFGGCMIRALSNRRPGYIKYANMIEWPKSVELVKDQFPDCDIIIPGHGFEGDSTLLQHTINILNTWNNN